jgi:hypothetical protein
MMLLELKERISAILEECQSMKETPPLTKKTLRIPEDWPSRVKNYKCC